jgi:hypothetical protein
MPNWSFSLLAFGIWTASEITLKLFPGAAAAIHQTAKADWHSESILAELVMDCVNA